MQVKIGLFGASGRMGNAIQSVLKAHGDLYHIDIISRKDIDVQMIQSKELDVLVDFSSNEGTKNMLQCIMKTPLPILIGTTGLDEETHKLITHKAQYSPVMVAPNTSLGANLVNLMCETVATTMSSEYDVNIIETHHKHKKDAPSGTAIMIKNTIKSVSGGIASLQIHSVRAGENIGRHEVVFDTPNESITLIHQAHSREIFAKGALCLASWLFIQTTGMYSPKDFFKSKLNDVL